MKLVIFARHAQAGKAKKRNDVKRELTAEGEEQVRMMGKALSLESLPPPGIVLTSHAKRAFQTASIIAKKNGLQKKDVTIHQKLYSNTTLLTVIDILKGLPDDLQTVVIVGHAPWIGSVISGFLPSFRFEIPKASAVCVRLDIMQWKEISPEKAILQYFKYSRGRGLPKLFERTAWNMTTRVLREMESVMEEARRNFLGKGWEHSRKTVMRQVKRYFSDEGVVTVRSIENLENEARQWEEIREEKMKQKEKKKLEKAKEREIKKIRKKNKKKLKKPGKKPIQEKNGGNEPYPDPDGSSENRLV